MKMILLCTEDSAKEKVHNSRIIITFFMGIVAITISVKSILTNG